jgi:DNA-binding transcriptional LysR family regulator
MESATPALDWDPWFRVMGIAEELRMKNTVRFTSYADAVSAAVAGQGVVIGRLPLLAQLLKDKRLVAPFGAGAASQRGYYIVTSAMGAANPDAQSFAHWLRAEAEDAAHAIVART